MSKINWKKVKGQFEREMFDKLKNLPPHREVSTNLLEFRSMISHEMPETAPKKLFRELIAILIQEKRIDLKEARKKYLLPQLKTEEQFLEKQRGEFRELHKSAADWVETHLPEEELQKQWQNHKTWLPRRYTIYKNQNLPFQKIAADTLARFCLIKGMLG